MIVRELLTLLGFDLDEAGAAKYEQRTEAVRKKVENTTTAIGRAWDRVGRSIDRSLDRADRGLANIQTGAENLSSSLGGLASMLGAGLTASWAIDVTSNYTDLQSRLKVALDSTDADAIALMNRLKEVASVTYQGIDQSIEAFLQMKPGLDQLGISTENQTKLLTSLNDALTVGGIKGEYAARAQFWLNRAFTIGKVSTEVFNGMLENSDDLVTQLEKSTGKTRGQLLEMAKAGKFTSKMLADHFLTTADEMREKAEEMPVTMADALTRMRQNLDYWLFGVDRAAGASNKFAQIILWFADRPAYAGSLALGVLAMGFAALAAQAVAAAAGLVRSLIGVVKWLRTVRLAQLAAFATNPWTLAAAGIAVAVLGVQDFVSWLNGAESVLGRLIGRYDEIKRIAPENRTFWQNEAMALAELAEGTKREIAGIAAAWDAYQKSDTSTGWGASLSAAWDLTKGIAGSLFEFNPDQGLPGFIKALPGYFDTAATWVTNLFTTLSTQWSAAWSSMTATLTGNLATAWSDVGTEFKRVFDGLKEWFFGWVDTIATKVGDIGGAIANSALGRAVGGAYNLVTGNSGGEVEVPGHATGTDNAKRGVAIVGENGPEAIQFRGGEKVIPFADRVRDIADRAASLRGPLVAGAGAMAGALAGPAAAAPAPNLAERINPPSITKSIGDITINSPVTIEPNTIPPGLNAAEVGRMIAEKAGAEAEKVLTRAIREAQRHFTEQE